MVDFLSASLVRAGVSVEIACGEDKGKPAHLPHGQVTLHKTRMKSLPLVRQAWVPGTENWLQTIINDFKPQIIHNHGIWLGFNHQVNRCAQKNQLPIVLSTHGCLDPHAFSHRAWKKKLALALYQRKDLEAVDCFHAASELEAESIRKTGLRQPIAVIPNGIEIPAAADKGEGIKDKGEMGERSLTSDLRPLTSSPRSGFRYALFIGRLHPIKNLPTLLRAWADVRPEGWVLRLAGADEVDHRAELEALAKELGISERVEFLGPKYGKDKEELFRSSELAFLVSHSENFGIAAAEALGWGMPVVASKSTPWACLEEENIGWWVDKDVEGIVSALSEYMKLSDSSRVEMSKRAAVYAAATFGWSAIAHTFENVYGWISGNREQPECVLT